MSYLNITISIYERGESTFNVHASGDMTQYASDLVQRIKETLAEDPYGPIAELEATLKHKRLEADLG